MSLCLFPSCFLCPWKDWTKALNINEIEGRDVRPEKFREQSKPGQGPWGRVPVVLRWPLWQPLEWPQHSICATRGEQKGPAVWEFPFTQ